MNVAIPVIFAFLIIYFQLPILEELKEESRTSSIEQIQKEESLVRIQLQILKYLPSLGFSNLIADWIFLDFIQYFGDAPARRQTGYTLSPDFFDVILSLDPYFREGYFFLSSSTSLFAGMPERTVEIIEREAPNLSPRTPDKAYYVWRYKGIDELLFLGDSGTAKESFETAADWASVYNDEDAESVEMISRQMVAFLETNPSSRYAQISAWVMVYYNALDQQTQRLAIQRIQGLGGQTSVNPNGTLNIQLPAGD